MVVHQRMQAPPKMKRRRRRAGAPDSRWGHDHRCASRGRTGHAGLPQVELQRPGLRLEPVEPGPAEPELAAVWAHAWPWAEELGLVEGSASDQTARGARSAYGRDPSPSAQAQSCAGAQLELGAGRGPQAPRRAALAVTPA